MSGMRLHDVVENGAKAGRRDAFHVPAVLCVADRTIYPGMNVRFLSPTKVVVCAAIMRQGIVNPFLRQSAEPGQAFWVLVHPDLVGDSLVHHFEVKGIPPEPVTEEEDEQFAGLEEEVVKLREELEEWKSKAEAAETSREEAAETSREEDEESYYDGCSGCY